jgi:formylglycine-generating enzyme required for sulfatase activity
MLSSSPIFSQKIKNVSFDMLKVEGGSFKLGNKYDIKLSTFYMAKHPVTQKIWMKIMGNNPSYFKGENLPIECVNLEDIGRFINKLNEQTGKEYHLPTEAQWEYAARGGNKSKGFKYSGSDNLDEVAWYWENSGDEKLHGHWDDDIIFNSNCRTHPVGSKKANELGIYDMSGNVWERCKDWYDDNFYRYNQVKINPENKAVKDIGGRVIRGGAWNDGSTSCEVTFRHLSSIESWDCYYGFRLAMSCS